MSNSLFFQVVPLCILILTLLFKPALAAPPTVGTITPSSGSTTADIAKSFTCSYSDLDGWANLKEAYLLISSQPSTDLSNALYLYYDQNSELLFLRNDTDTAWLGGFTPGSATLIENSSVKLNCRTTTAVGGNSALLINWEITFKTNFIGLKNMYLKVLDDTGQGSGWIQKGTWRMNQSSFIRGDANNDGRLDISDAITILLYLFKAASLPILEAADVNGDGLINISDPIYFLRFVFHGGPKPPPPFPEPGDFIAPSGIVKINADAQWTNSTSVTLTLSAQDNAGGSGLSQMQFSHDNLTWLPPETYAPTKSWTLTNGDGQKTVYVRFKDIAGNDSEVVSDTIILDTSSPQIRSITPRSGSTFYENTPVPISLTVNDIDASGFEYQFFIDGNLKQGWSPKSTWTWSATRERHKIKVEVRDNKGGSDSASSDVYVFREFPGPPGG